MPLDAKVIILEYICPAMGCLLANIMFLAPLKDLRAAVIKGEIGSLNPSPWAFMFGNCFGWVTYGILLQNYWVVFANSQGLLISIYLNLGAAKLLYQKHHFHGLRNSVANLLVEQERRISMRYSSASLAEKEKKDDDKDVVKDLEINKDELNVYYDVDIPKSAADWRQVLVDVTSQTKPAPTPHENLVMALAIIWWIIIAIISLIPSISHRNREIIVASSVNLNLVFFYGAPLSTIYTVTKSRDSSSIHIQTMITNTLNGCFWTAYGIAVFDLFIAIPNGLGAFFGIIQMVLCVIFPRERKPQVNSSTNNA